MSLPAAGDRWRQSPAACEHRHRSELAENVDLRRSPGPFQRVAASAVDISRRRSLQAPSLRWRRRARADRSPRTDISSLAELAERRSTARSAPDERRRAAASGRTGWPGSPAGRGCGHWNAVSTMIEGEDDVAELQPHDGDHRHRRVALARVAVLDGAGSQSAGAGEADEVGAQRHPPASRRARAMRGEGELRMPSVRLGRIERLDPRQGETSPVVQHSIRRLPSRLKDGDRPGTADREYLGSARLPIQEGRQGDACRSARR